MNLALVLVLLLGVTLLAAVYVVRILNRARLRLSLRNESEPRQLIASLEKIVAGDPDDFDSWFKLVDTHRSNGDLGEAIRRLDALIARATGRKGFDAKRAYAALGDCYVEAGKLDDALKTYAALHRTDPEDPAPYVRMGRIEKGRGNAEKAAHYLTKALALAPDDVDILKDLAVLTHETSGGPEAQMMFKSVLAARPDDAESHFRLGKIEMQFRNHKAAYPHFLISKDTKEFAVQSLVSIGIILARFAKHDHARRIFTAALRLPSVGKEEALEIRYELGESLLASKDIPGAIEQWEKILGTVNEYRDVSEKLERYEQTKTNSLMHTYLICSFQDFVGLCERVAKNFARSVVVIRSDPQRDQSLELTTQASYRDVSGPVLFKFYRGTSTVGQLSIREFYEKLRETKAKFGICFTATDYTDEAQSFALGRVIELHGRRDLARLLSKKGAR
jgi:tetratricopeptide (TPR) repeat protein